MLIKPIFDLVSQKFPKFILVGLTLFLFGLVAYYITLEVWHLPLYPTYVAIYIISIYLSFRLNAKYTFNQKRSAKKLGKYYLVFLGGLAFGLGLLWIFGHLFDFRPFYLVYLVLVPRVAFTYVLSKGFVFSED